ncbi:hypothetical protein J3E72DRAFT_332178, partial [Bipolaris maydis]|uniref:uncharacterized protein n=1 Tax=Cochliobolus heterostrophus TaxID=5016 RepID=UPI0024D56129
MTTMTSTHTHTHIKRKNGVCLFNHKKMYMKRSLTNLHVYTPSTKVLSFLKCCFFFLLSYHFRLFLLLLFRYHEGTNNRRDPSPHRINYCLYQTLANFFFILLAFAHLL